MNRPGIKERRRDRVWIDRQSGDFDTFCKLVSQTTRKKDWPFASAIKMNIPVYDGQLVDRLASIPADARMLMAEWCEALGRGPGVIAISGAFADTSPIDDATLLFERIIRREKGGSKTGGDHFATAGANDRIWNALEKQCLADPENFARYFSCPTIALASTAWLGPGYQMTAQVNVVRPGGKAQSPHRDYHLGFMEPERMTQFPAHIHDLSPVLTLQGAVAHCDMPAESGPTMLLPYSQCFREGYLAFTRDEYQDWFRGHHVQLPLKKGDVLFFNPALMHGAGENRSAAIQRMANLLQVSSPFGRAMESVDRAAMGKVLLPVLKAMVESGTLPLERAEYAVASCAEGYPFPADLDTNPPVGGLAPGTPQQIMLEALHD